MKVGRLVAENENTEQTDKQTDRQHSEIIYVDGKASILLQNIVKSCYFELFANIFSS